MLSSYNPIYIVYMYSYVWIVLFQAYTGFECSLWIVEVHIQFLFLEENDLSTSIFNYTSTSIE